MTDAADPTPAEALGVTQADRAWLCDDIWLSIPSYLHRSIQAAHRDATPAPSASGEADEHAHIEETELEMTQDGAYGDGPMTRGAARDRLAAIRALPAAQASSDAGLPDGWRLYTMDCSIVGRVSVMLQGPVIDHPADEDGHIDHCAQYVSGSGPTQQEAIAEALSRAKGQP